VLRISLNLVLLVFLIYGTNSLKAHEVENPSIRFAIPDSTQIQVLKLKDGSKYIGRITEIGVDQVKFKTEFGEFSIPKSKIEDIKVVSKSSLKEGKYWFPNPNYSRLFFSPTARMLKKGAGYFADYYLFFPTVSYGVTENFTIGGGMSILPTSRLDEQLVYFSIKLGLMRERKFKFAVGSGFVNIPFFDDSHILGVLYGVGTYGSLNESFTFGIGYIFYDSEFANKPIIMVGGETRISKRVSLVSENVLFPGEKYPLISYGVRIFGEKLSVDLVLVNTLGEDALFPGIPYVDFVANF